MSKRSSRKQKRRVQDEPEETQAAEVVTVVWTLSVLTGLFCDVGAALALLYVSARGGVQADQPDLVVLLSVLLFFAATIIGVLSMILLPIVLRVRQVPPPRGFVVFAVLVAVAPILAMIVQRMQ